MAFTSDSEVLNDFVTTHHELRNPCATRPCPPGAKFWRRHCFYQDHQCRYHAPTAPCFAVSLSAIQWAT